MLRKVAITLNSIAALISLLMFSFTFFAETHITTKTRAFVAEKSLEHSKPLIAAADLASKHPLALNYLSTEQLATMQQEVDLYKSAPNNYILALVSQSNSSFGNDKVGKFKQSVNSYYQTTLHELICDIRIFTGSNLVASIAALALLLISDYNKKSLTSVFSLIVFGVVAYSAYEYIEGVSFFRILFKWHPGWQYPTTMGLLIIHLFREYLKARAELKAAE